MRQATLIRTADIRIVAHSDGYAVTTPYSEAFVAAFKATVPTTERKWDKPSRTWIVSLNSGNKVQTLIQEHFGYCPELPQTHQEGPQTPQMRILDLRYLGATKARDDGTETANGWVDNGWNAIFPKAVLMTWFGQEQRPDEAPTLYGVLGLRMDAKPDDIKKAHKRLVRQWHPDVSREPGTVEQFHAIQEAYEILANSGKRARYDAGLKLEGEFISKAKYKREAAQPFRSPDRCGLVFCSGVSLLGRFVVSQIHSWQEIVNSRGQVLITSWPMDAKRPVEMWVEP